MVASKGRRDNFISWVAVAGLAVTAGTAAYSASQAKSSAPTATGGSAIHQYSPYLINPGQVNTVDPLKAETQSLTANQALMPYAQKQAGDINSFNYAQANHYYNKIQPYFSNLQSQIGQNASQLASGQLPSDVTAQIQRNAASQGIQNGFGFGSGGGQTGLLANLNLRNLGLNSLQAMQQGDQLGLQANQEAKGLLPNLASSSQFLTDPNTLLGAQQFNAGQLNSILSQNAGYQNQANAANAGAFNAAAQYNSQANQSANLASAGITAQGGSQIAGILGKYFSNNSGAAGGSLLGGSSGASSPMLGSQIMVGGDV